MDRDMGYLLSELERVGLKVSTNLIIVSDHGMAAPSEEKFVLLDKIIDLDDVRVVGWGPVSMIRPAEGKRVGPFELVHIYEMICHILDLKPADNDGSFGEVQHLIRK